eukprot:GFYU01006402.1.p1 GENE.GFYU01006402.1~~GFYU01006402.1.p1  ORF type:complete len:526 (-),score=97.25 GFYU01006402.1:31-1488(-)
MYFNLAIARNRLNEKESCDEEFRQALVNWFDQSYIQNWIVIKTRTGLTAKWLREQVEKLIAHEPPSGTEQKSKEVWASLADSFIGASLTKFGEAFLEKELKKAKEELKKVEKDGAQAHKVKHVRAALVKMYAAAGRLKKAHGLYFPKDEEQNSVIDPEDYVAVVEIKKKLSTGEKKELSQSGDPPTEDTLRTKLAGHEHGPLIVEGMEAMKSTDSDPLFRMLVLGATQYPESELLYTAMGDLILREKDKEPLALAEKFYVTAEHIGGASDVKIYKKLYKVAVDQNNEEKGIEVLRRARRQFPSDLTVLCNLANGYARLAAEKDRRKNYEYAARHFEEYISRKPADIDQRIKFAKVLWALDKRARTKKELDLCAIQCGKDKEKLKKVQELQEKIKSKSSRSLNTSGSKPNMVPQESNVGLPSQPSFVRVNDSDSESPANSSRRRTGASRKSRTHSKEATLMSEGTDLVMRKQVGNKPEAKRLAKRK